jgi:uroporphyrin-III C-methyltransferase/precorrin-2 dehydrogenase/sirohydrochlorin ferrochelatase
VAVSSGGAAPTLARLLRERLEALLPERLGALARFAERFRPAVRAVVGGKARRGFWEDFFRGPLAARVLAGDEAGAAGRMLALVNAPVGKPAAGRVALVGAGPGSADLLTLRALQLLQEADVIVHDRLASAAVLDHARREATRIPVGKRRGAHTLPQSEINALLVRLAGEGKRVVRLKGGDPFIFGRGGEEAEALRRAGIDVEIVPGVTAALASAARTAVPLTHRGAAHAVTLVAAERGDGSAPDWAAVAALGQTIVIYMGVGAAAAIAAQLQAHGLAPATPCVVVENATLAEERVVAGRLAELPALIADHAIVGPATIIVGAVVALGAVAAQPAAAPLRLAAAR